MNIRSFFLVKGCAAMAKTIDELSVVTPAEVLGLEGGQYRSLGIFRGEQTLPSRIVPNLPVAVERFFV